LQEHADLAWGFSILKCEPSRELLILLASRVAAAGAASYDAQQRGALLQAHAGLAVYFPPAALRVFDAAAVRELTRDDDSTPTMRPAYSSFTPALLASMMRGFVLVGNRPTTALSNLVDRLAAEEVHRFTSKHATTLVRATLLSPYSRHWSLTTLCRRRRRARMALCGCEGGQQAP